LPTTGKLRGSHVHPGSLEKATKAQRGVTVSALGRGGRSTPRPGRSTPGKDPVPIVKEAGWAPGSVPAGIRFPDRPALSESNYISTKFSVPVLIKHHAMKAYNRTGGISHAFFASALE
jgi:hypothetical protein